MGLSHGEHCEPSRADAVASSFTEFMQKQLAPGGEEAAGAVHGLAHAWASCDVPCGFGKGCLCWLQHTWSRQRPAGAAIALCPEMGTIPHQSPSGDFAVFCCGDGYTPCDSHGTAPASPWGPRPISFSGRSSLGFVYSCICSHCCRRCGFLDSVSPFCCYSSLSWVTLGLCLRNCRSMDALSYLQHLQNLSWLLWKQAGIGHLDEWQSCLEVTCGVGQAETAS